MLLSFSDEVKEHLAILNTLSPDVVKEFCRISMQNIKMEANNRIYQSAANKLEVDVNSVRRGVEGLAHLFMESAKLMLNEIDFEDSIMILGFSEELRKLLLQEYLEHRTEYRQLLSKMSMDLPEYHNLEWRFDINLATRSLKQQITPVIIFKLHTSQGNNTHATVLQTDPVNLVHLTHTLEEALKELKQSHCRRIVRNI